MKKRLTKSSGDDDSNLSIRERLKRKNLQEEQLNSQLETANEQIELLNNKLNISKVAIDTLKEEVNMLTNKLRDGNSNENPDPEITELKLQYEQSKIQIIELEEKLQLLQVSNTKLVNENNALTSQCEEQKLQITKLKANLQAIQNTPAVVDNDSDSTAHSDDEASGILTLKSTFSGVPVHWVPDSQAKQCSSSLCNVHFGIFKRKHHCRICGSIFCNFHVRNRIPLNSHCKYDASGSKQKVCTDCHGKALLDANSRK